jgi:hypothetical protein
MAALSEADYNRLRENLGEVIPEGGADTDTFFTDDQIQDLWDQMGTLTGASWLGWVKKASDMANNIDLQSGATRLALSALHKQALAQVKLFWDQYIVDLTGTVSGGNPRVVATIAKLNRWETGPSGVPAAWPATDEERLFPIHRDITK